jgi:hypothetical protein
MKYLRSRLGGVIVSVLASGPKVRGLKPRLGDGLRTMKFRSTPFFGEEVKPEAPCRKVLRQVKYHFPSIKNCDRPDDGGSNHL